MASTRRAQDHARKRGEGAPRPADREAQDRPGRRFLPPVLLLLVSAIAYVNADHEAFLFDSVAQMVAAESPGDQPGGRGIARELIMPGEQLSLLTYAANRAISRTLGLREDDITTFLAVNVAIHGINACLVYLLIANLLYCLDPGRRPSPWICFVPAVLFAVHPMHAGSVAYIIQRRGTLSTMFYLLAVIAYLHARRARGGPDKSGSGLDLAGATDSPKLKWTVAVGLAILFFYASVHSKQLGLTLPIAILAIEFVLRAPDRQRLRRFLWLMAPALALAVLGLFVFLWQAGRFDPQRMAILPHGPETLWGAWPHFLTESRVFVHYWKLLILPLPRWSCIDHDVAVSYSLAQHGAVVAIVFHGLLLALATWAAVRGYALAAIGVFWFYIALIPYALLPQAELLVEYKTYLPSVGLALLVAELVRRVAARVPMMVQMPAVALIGLVLLATTLSRNWIYKSDLNLWTDALAKSPNKPRVHLGLGRALMNAGDLDRAVVHLRRALEIKTDYLNAAYSLGEALGRKNEPRAAAEAFTRAVEIDPEFVLAHVALGTTLIQIGEIEKGRHHYIKAIQLDPHYAPAHYQMGSLLYDEGDYEKAARHFTRAVELQPDHVQAISMLGNVRWRQNDPAGAAELYRKALAVDPAHAFSHRNLADLLLSTGDVDSAIDHYREALRLRPEWWPAVSDLAWQYASAPSTATPGPPAALKLAELACTATNRGQPVALGALAAACFASGRSSEGQAVARQAIQLAASAGRHDLAAQLQSRLQEMQAGRPSQETPKSDHR